MSKVLKAFGRRLNRKANRENPSVSDFNSDKDLFAAMRRRSKTLRRSLTESSRSESASSSSGGDEYPSVEWELSIVDQDETEPQNMEDEVKRLRTLQSYFILDAEGEEEFDRITRMASQLFDAPIALVSLVDLGRQWFLSRHGLPVAETERKHSFCAHVILNKYKMLVVPDATKDFRFKDNPFVKDGLKVRFYAGAALVSPEGYKLGTLCIISPEPRTEGFGVEQQALLHEMAGMVVSAMVARRNRLLKEEYESRFHGLAKTFVDTNRVLGDAQKTLEGVLKRNSWQMDSEDTADLGIVTRNLGLQAKICAGTTRTLLEDTPHLASDKNSNEVDEDEKEEGFKEISDSLFTAYDSIVNPTTNLEELFKNLNSVAKSLPFGGQIRLEMEKNVPKEIVAEDLLLFRSALNLLTHCMGNKGDCEEGYQKSGIRICLMKNRSELLVQALQYGLPTKPSVAKAMFADQDSLLAPVATMVRSMGGRHGMFEGRWDHQDGANSPTQSIFWFRVPFSLPAKPTVPGKLQETLVETHFATPKSDGLKKDVSSDPFQATVLSTGCGSK